MHTQPRRNKLPDTWLKERGQDAYCPVDLTGDNVIIYTGLTILSDKAPGKCVGTFWYTADGDVDFELNEEME